jgi:predicted flap endonuclease-1-like 5' DNA nuclease
MGIFDFIFGKKNKPSSTQQPVKELQQAPQQYRDIATENSDVTDGMKFVATCQLRTPLSVLKRHGEIYRGNEEPPTYGEPRDGIWIPKLSGEYDFLSEGREVASDAGSVNADEYISYVTGIKEILESNVSINDKMRLAIAYAGGNEAHKRIEKGLMTCHRESTIADVMARYISDSERLEYYFDKPNRLTLINGVNKKVESALEESGISTIKELAQLSESELVKINGIGKVSAQKITAALKKD